MENFLTTLILFFVVCLVSVPIYYFSSWVHSLEAAFLGSVVIALFVLGICGECVRILIDWTSDVDGDTGSE